MKFLIFLILMMFSKVSICELIAPEPYVPVYKYESLNGKYAFLREKRDFDGYEGIGVYKIIKSKDDKVKYELLWKFTDFEKRLNKTYSRYSKIMFYLSNNGEKLVILNTNKIDDFFRFYENNKQVGKISFREFVEPGKCNVPRYNKKYFKQINDGKVEILLYNCDQKVIIDIKNGKVDENIKVDLCKKNPSVCIRNF